MDKVLLLVVMVFLHIFADFHLQGILANMKQHGWWNKQVENCDESIYKSDYKISLLIHSFEWAFVMMLPLLNEIYYSCWGFHYYSLLAAGTYIVLLAVNVFIHYKVDDAKANRKTINLVKDQVIHLGQIIATWGIFITVTWKLFLTW